MKYGTKKRNKFLNSNKGISMVELICSLGIASLLAATFFRFFVVTAEVEINAQAREKAQLIAMDTIEEYKVNRTVSSPVYYTKSWTPCDSSEAYYILEVTEDDAYNLNTSTQVNGVGTYIDADYESSLSDIPENTVVIVQSSHPTKMNVTVNSILVSQIEYSEPVVIKLKKTSTISSTDPKIKVINNLQVPVKVMVNDTNYSLHKDSIPGVGITYVNYYKQNSNKSDSKINITIRDNRREIFRIEEYIRYGE